MNKYELREAMILSAIDPGKLMEGLGVRNHFNMRGSVCTDEEMFGFVVY